MRRTMRIEDDGETAKNADHTKEEHDEEQRPPGRDDLQRVIKDQGLYGE